MDFIRVHDCGFVEAGLAWTCLGANCYYLMTRAADPALRHEVLTVLDAAKDLGLTTIRTWAFADGTGWNHLQPECGQYDERVFAGLDYVIAEAKARNLRLILVLSNYWPDYGGLQAYVSWGKGCPQAGASAEEFYTDPHCHALYEAHARAILLRTNTRTSTPYCNEPAIMAWEICNEPRCRGQHTSTTAEAMHGWIARAATYVKGLDKNHLVTVGTEGFFGSSSPGLQSANPSGCQHEGCDFMRTLLTPGIDFASFHLHPDHWLPRLTGHAAVACFVRRWIMQHATACREANKPWVLSEFGSRQRACSEWKGCSFQHAANTTPSPICGLGCGLSALRHRAEAQAEAGCMEREALYEEVLSLCLDGSLSQQAAIGQRSAGTAAPSHQAPAGGAIFWMLAAPSYPDYDGFTIYPSIATGHCLAGQEGSAFPLIQKDSEAVAAVVRRWSERKGQRRLITPVPVQQ